MSVAPFHVGQLLSARARLNPQHVGARDLGRSLTYRQWNQRACQLANALIGLGLVKGDRVAVLAYNRIEWAEIYAAAAKAGLIAVPINFRLTAPEVEFILESSGASALIVEDTFRPLLNDLDQRDSTLGQRRIVLDCAVESSGDLSYEGLVAKASDHEPAVQVVADDPWCLMYTSGTTGKPKGAIRSHRGMAMLALMTAIELKLHAQDDALLVMPLCHANSLNFFTAFMYCGARVSVFSKPSFDPALLLRTLTDFGSTFTSLVPTHYRMLLDLSSAERGAATFDGVEKLMISSAPARAETKREVMAMFPNSGLYELYGSTEAGWVTMLHPNEQFTKLGTVGREVVGSLPIKLLDDDGVEVPDGEPGELYSSSPYGFDGYWQRPDATAQAMRGDYLSVGDIAIRDDDGFIRLVDRKKNIIITGGENVYPSEVESLLASHPAISDVAVVGQPDPTWGEKVTAAVVLRPQQKVEAETLIAWTKDRIAGYKRPRSVIFLNEKEMPRNATGKIMHRELRTLIGTRQSPPLDG